MDKPISLSRNVVFNVGGYVISVVASFLITPITIHTLGDARYGAWSLVAELIGYYGLLDLGIRGAVTYYVARYSARNQGEDVKETVSSAFWLLSACGALALFIGAGFTFAFPYLFRTEGMNLTEVRHSLLIMSALIGVSLPMNVFAGSLIGKQRFDIVTSVEVVTRVLTAIAVYVALRAGGGLVALALIQTAGRMVYWTLTLSACRSVLGGVFARPAWFKMQRVRDLTGYGLRNVVGQVARMVIYRIDLTVVGMFVGIGHITYYSIAGALISYASALCTSFTFAFTPRFTQLKSSNGDDDLHRLYLFGTRVTGMVVTGLVAGMLIFGKDFIRLWLGASYVNGPWTDRSDIIMVILILAHLPYMLQSISRQLLLAMARVRFLMWLNVCEAIANLSLSLLLVRRYGPAGVALGTLFPMAASQLLVMPVYITRTFKIPLLDFFRKGFSIPLFTGVLTACVGMACMHVAPPDSWRIFFLDILVTATLGGVLCLALGFSREERREQLARLWPRRSARTATTTRS
jgi:O-antigen/teichoic acid export membrane protein